MVESREVPDPDSPLDALRARTPARLFAGRAGMGYRTATVLRLREDHAFAGGHVVDTFDVDVVRGPQGPVERGSSDAVADGAAPVPAHGFCVGERHSVPPRTREVVCGSRDPQQGEEVTPSE